MNRSEQSAIVMYVIDAEDSLGIARIISELTAGHGGSDGIVYTI
jgi:hypothetical protein